MLTVGDYEIRNSNDHFMRFYKRLQGGSYTGEYSLDSFGVVRPQVSLALAKGKFARNLLQVSEGNQGPYRLTGANGETFIIVQAGTERVYVNGKLMKRGSNFDYVIDYNLGEITFTPNVLVTRDLRISVEFEYSDRNYFRSLIYLSNDYVLNEKFKGNISFFSEQDNKNQPVQADLTTEQKLLLADIGDSLDRAFFPGARPVEFQSDRILYKIDTIIANDTVYAYSTNPDSALFTLTFSFLGQGRGSYQPAQTTANGRVYRYVSPRNGIPQGSYEPVIVLITPKREQMLTISGEYTPNKKDKLSVAFGLSNDDNNTFSEQGNNNNAGYAGWVGYERKFAIGSVDTNKVLVTTNASYEYLNRNFDALERFRSVEFNRDWNFNQINQQSNLPTDRRIDDSNDQHLAEAGFTIGNRKYASIGYRFATFQIANGVYEGYRQQVKADVNRKGYVLDFDLSYLSSTSTIDRSKFIRPTVTAYKAFEKLNGWRIGGAYAYESNKIRDVQTDTLTNTGFVFSDWRVYIGAPDSADNRARLEYIRRLEFFPRDNEMDLQNVSNTYNFTGAWTSNPINTLKWQLTYRQFQNQDSTEFTTGDNFEQYYLGRIEYGLNVGKGLLVSNILYELGSGRDQIRQFAYIPNLSGQGTYIWNDRNENGVKELNEFDVVPFGGSGFDTLYVRVAVPTNEFAPVNITTYNQSISLNPKAKLYGKKGVLGFVAKFSTITSVQLTRKVFRGADISPFNPFVLDVSDDELVSTNNLFRNSVFFNRSSSLYSVEYTYQNNQNKNNLASGFETRELIEHQFRIRWNIAKAFSAEVKYTRGQRNSSAETFTDRNFQILGNEVAPRLTYLYKTKFRASLQYDMFLKKNVLPGGDNEEAVQHRLLTELRYNVVSKSTISAELSYANVEYTGTANTALEFAMLNGLQNGNNYVWNFTFERTLGNNIQFSLIYEGRQTGDAETIHTGRAQVRAIF